jgi:hypothetical protein
MGPKQKFNQEGIFICSSTLIPAVPKNISTYNFFGEIYSRPTQFIGKTEEYSLSATRDDQS